MPKTKRTTIRFDGGLHKALRAQAHETDRTISEIVNSAVRERLREDACDLAVFRKRAKEPVMAFEKLVRRLKLDR